MNIVKTAAVATLVLLTSAAFAQTVRDEGAADIGGTQETAVRLSVGDTITGQIASADDEDFFVVEAPPEQVLWIQLKSTGGSAGLMAGHGPDSYSLAPEGNATVLTARDAPRSQYFVVKGDAGAYSLKVGQLMVDAATASLLPDEPFEPGPWQTNFAAFGVRVQQRAADYGPKFAQGSSGSVMLLASGGCSGARANFPGFGPIRFEAKFKGMDEEVGETQRRRHGPVPTVDLEMKGNSAVVLHVYPASDALAEWRGLKKGSKLEFVANVNCIAAFRLGRDVYAVTLHDARPFPIK